MIELLALGNRGGSNLLVLFSDSSLELCDELFLAALQWGTSRIPTVASQYFTDPARLSTIRFHYTDNYPLEKAASLSFDPHVRADDSLIIVETDQQCYLEEHAVANTLALLASFSCGKLRSIVTLPHDEDLVTTVSLFILNRNNVQIHPQLFRSRNFITTKHGEVKTS
ncbi:unnamed protein product [Nippostrongylus brasiliensis]|uniref:AMP-binding domain-containing protein n=1 Tax=Nippostrongylus brasiliensis TaxID=27835 RepID=A0A0N4YMD1_NIPBR|nr:unnamed protein product [Nippostrongylus brasiliensis]